MRGAMTTRSAGPSLPSGAWRRRAPQPLRIALCATVALLAAVVAYAVRDDVTGGRPFATPAGAVVTGATVAVVSVLAAGAVHAYISRVLEAWREPGGTRRIPRRGTPGPRPAIQDDTRR